MLVEFVCFVVSCLLNDEMFTASSLSAKWNTKMDEYVQFKKNGRNIFGDYLHFLLCHMPWKTEVNPNSSHNVYVFPVSCNRGSLDQNI
jgi:hypothetical protein